ncbi:MAG: signal peptidase II [Chloroflexota bacterium]|nr:signal peptidase II [Chloroflexota bacterium]
MPESQPKPTSRFWQSKIVSFPLCIGLVLGLDQLSKFLIRMHLSLGQSISDDGFLTFRRVHNPGGVWGLDAPPILWLALSLVVLIFITWFYFRYIPSGQLFATVSIGMVLGGTLGNLTDRLWHGHVIDFIDIRLCQNYHWPTFNIADCAIVVGAFGLAYYMLRATFRDQQQDMQAS